MKTNLFILHSLNGNTKDSFKDSVTEIAQRLGYNVIYPIFPTSKNASYNNFKSVMTSYSGVADCVVIAHSISSNWLIKYINEFKIDIKALISVGGAIELSPKEICNKNDYHYFVKQESLPTNAEIDFAKTHIKHIYLYYSDNDHHSTDEMFTNFIHRLNATPIFCKGYGHFTMRHNIKELPNIEKILNELQD